MELRLVVQSYFHYNTKLAARYTTFSTVSTSELNVVNSETQVEHFTGSSSAFRRSERSVVNSPLSVRSYENVDTQESEDEDPHPGSQPNLRRLTASNVVGAFTVKKTTIVALERLYKLAAASYGPLARFKLIQNEVDAGGDFALSARSSVLFPRLSATLQHPVCKVLLQMLQSHNASCGDSGLFTLMMSSR